MTFLRLSATMLFIALFAISCSNVRVAKGFKTNSDTNSDSAQNSVEANTNPDIRTVEQLIANTDLEGYSDDELDLSSLTLDQGPQQKHKIPHEINTAVKKWIYYFTHENREWFQRSLTRSEKYEANMKNILIKYGVPEELFYVAFIESGFVQNARSRARAQGIWQFMKSTAKLYGLKVNYGNDERNHPYKATAAAAAHLRDLYNIYGSWYLAIASYNAGEFRIRRAILRHKERNFWELAEKHALPDETMNYVPKFMAARIIAENPAKFGFQYNGPSKDVETIAEEVEELVSIEKYDRVMPDPRKIGYNKEAGVYKVRRGDNLWTIARRIRVPINRLKECNPSLSNNRIYPGQKLSTKCTTVSRRSNPGSVNSGGTYTVRNGDNLWMIAKRHRTTVAELRRCNDTVKRHTLFPGQKLTLSCAGENENDRVVHTVRRGESLWSIAQKYKVSVSDIARSNNLRRTHRIFAGRKLVIPTNGG
ncbi:MAG: LysM peptidoglycan-binding domain-containing protein [Oligoflexia bacterium]|nr:LysM peptidoglycan-binding domain-containing protein [Oligoflexia bacterium]